MAHRLCPLPSTSPQTTDDMFVQSCYGTFTALEQGHEYTNPRKTRVHISQVFRKPPVGR
jgi:hypothetical protein